jgi:hypothetical protein
MRGKLTDRKVQTAKRGKYADGGNLYLIVSEAGARKWVFRFQWQGRAKERGLGSASDVPLAEARVRASDARLMLAKGINPIEAAKRDSGVPTFGTMADEVCETLGSGFRNAKHRAQWKSTLQTHAAPLRSLSVDAIDTTHLLAVLQAIWQAKPETASRLRGRIEKVLDAAKAKGFRQGETRLGGEATSIISCRLGRSFLAVTMRRCLTTSCRSSWRTFGFVKELEGSR